MILQLELIRRLKNLKNSQLSDTKSQIQTSGTGTEQFREKLWNGQVPFLDSTISYPVNIQKSNIQRMTTFHGDKNIPPLTITTQYIGGRLVRDKQTKERIVSSTNFYSSPETKIKRCMCLWFSRMA